MARVFWAMGPWWARNSLEGSDLRRVHPGPKVGGGVLQTGPRGACWGRPSGSEPGNAARKWVPCGGQAEPLSLRAGSLRAAGVKPTWRGRDGPGARTVPSLPRQLCLPRGSPLLHGHGLGPWLPPQPQLQAPGPSFLVQSHSHPL